MAKHVVIKKKRKLRLSGVVGALFMVSLIMAFVSQVFVRTNNQNTANTIQDIKNQIADVQTSNDLLSAEVKALSESARIVGIAEAAGLEASTNTVTVKGE